jgi:outer membrane protein insertion porin family
MSVEFDAESPLSEALRVQAVKGIQQQEFWITPDEGDSDWVNQAIQPIRDALREQGYFKTSVEATPHLIRALPAEKFYVLRVAIDAGRKYYLGKLGFANADPDDPSLVFPEDLLRQQIPLKEGELFDVSKIRNGLEALGKLYGSQGFIDETPEPDTSVNDETSRVDLVIRIDQEKRYRIGRIEFLGLNAKTASEISVPQESGDFFNRSLWDGFFEEGKSKLQPKTSMHEGVRLRRNSGDGTVDVILGFRACPQAQTPAN